MLTFADTSAAKAVSMPFDKAQNFLRRKASVTSERWTDIWQEQHAAAFTVAGATKQALVDDLRAAVQSAIDDGTTLVDFQKRFREIALEHGWAYKGSEAWRAKTIFETNLRTAYAAGRYEQLQAAKRLMPYWRYRVGASKNHRAEHLAWDGIILRADDPWWDTHFTPNGWGCKCKIEAVSRSELREMGIDPAELVDGKCVRTLDGKPAIADIPFANQFYEWKSKDGSRTERVPVGVQPGWAYNVGKAGVAAGLRQAEARRAEEEVAEAQKSPEQRLKTPSKQGEKQEVRPEQQPIVASRPSSEATSAPAESRPSAATGLERTRVKRKPQDRMSARHIFSKTKQNQPVGKQNTLFAPGIDSEADLAAIDSGQAERFATKDGVTGYRVNGRTYLAHGPGGDDSVYPVSGPGVFTFDRDTYKAIRMLKLYGIARFERAGFAPEVVTVAKAFVRAFERGK